MSTTWPDGRHLALAKRIPKFDSNFIAQCNATLTRHLPPMFHPTPLSPPQDALVYFPSNGSLRLDLLLLRSFRSLHANFTLDSVGDERTLLTLAFRSDMAKIAAHQRRMARPRFPTPWRDEDTQIQVKIAEELPVNIFG